MMTHYEEAAAACGELAVSFLTLRRQYEEGTDPVTLRSGIEQLESACASFFGEALHLALRPTLVAALERLIPIPSLPMHYGSHVQLADELVFAIAGKMVLVEKEHFDRISVDSGRQVRVG
jgi:hypothetical protein